MGRLFVVHYHFRVGGIRRIIEQAVPWILRYSADRLHEVIFVSGEAPDDRWSTSLRDSVHPYAVRFVQIQEAGYLDVHQSEVAQLTVALRRSLRELFCTSAREQDLIWVHNPAVGRNLILSEEIGRAAKEHGIFVVWHHHDWWFDNRWQRWPEIRKAGFRSLDRVATTMFPPRAGQLHIAINSVDAAILAHYLPTQSAYLPNLTTFSLVPDSERAQVKAWLHKVLGINDEPIWLMPTRILRRKNLAEAFLLYSWLRPNGWLLVTGGPSSEEEKAYSQTLERFAQQRNLRVRLAFLERLVNPPPIRSLIAASEAVLMTSIQEGFGLSYLEPVKVGTPLLARRLTSVVSDLEKFGFSFSALYDDILVPPDLFDWKAERIRQQCLYRIWKSHLPHRCRNWAGKSPLLKLNSPMPVPFSRLTLTGQLEVLRHDSEKSFLLCSQLNRWLKDWREMAESRCLPCTKWPESASELLSGEAYAARFWKAVEKAESSGKAPDEGSVCQLLEAFIRDRLRDEKIFPLLWAVQS